jgi:hypothetical protein
MSGSPITQSRRGTRHRVSVPRRRHARTVAPVAAIALCFLVPGTASGRVITAETNLGGSCKLVSSVARGAVIDYSVQVASSTCQVATRIRHVGSTGLLYDVDTNQQVDTVPALGSQLPYFNGGDYTPNPLVPPPPGEVDDTFRSRFDISVLLRCPRRPGPGPPGTARNCGPNESGERWIDPGGPCRVATKYRFRDRLICRLQDSIPV